MTFEFNNPLMADSFCEDDSSLSTPEQVHLSIFEDKFLNFDFISFASSFTGSTL